MKQVYIDVTQLVGWQGKLTGIPRVMDEMCVRFLKSDNYTLIAWDESGFRKIKSEEITDRDKIAYEQSYPPAPYKISRIKMIGKAVVVKAPQLNSARHALKSRLNKSKPKHNLQTEDTIKIENGDKVLILWGAWHDQSFIDSMVAAQAIGATLVQVVYDMLPLVTPQYSGHSTEWLKNYAKTIYPICELLLAISNHTSKDVTKWLKLNNLHVPSIEVLRLGDDIVTNVATKPNDSHFIDAKLKGLDYILCVGTIESRKNHTLLYYTYKLAIQRGINLPKLVIVGRRGWLSDDIFVLLTTDPDIYTNIIILEHTDDSELVWLYNHSLFTIYPSFYEGWGLPIAESVARGVPCIASNTSSMPEIAGDLINYFSPFSADECLSAIQNLLIPSNLEEAKRQVAKYKPISWDETFVKLKKYLGGER